MKLQGLSLIKLTKVYNSDICDNTKTTVHNVGSRTWAIRAYDFEGNMLKEFCGSNGVNPCEKATDLWSYYNKWLNEVAYSYKIYRAPDGVIGSYKYFLKEVSKGRTHGLIIVF